MKIAIEEAQRAFQEDEIPIGALIIKDSEIISKAHNTNRAENDPTKHAEMTAIQIASKALNNERLTNCDLYVTKEPCAMCAGAIIHARIKRVIIAATDEKYGACGTKLLVCGNPELNHIPEIIFGILEQEAVQLLKDFFKEKREK